MAPKLICLKPDSFKSNLDRGEKKRQWTVFKGDVFSTDKRLSQTNCFWSFFPRNSFSFGTDRQLHIGHYSREKKSKTSNTKKSSCQPNTCHTGKKSFVPKGIPTFSHRKYRIILKLKYFLKQSISFFFINSRVEPQFLIVFLFYARNEQ